MHGDWKEAKSIPTACPMALMPLVRSLMKESIAVNTCATITQAIGASAEIDPYIQLPRVPVHVETATSAFRAAPENACEYRAVNSGRVEGSLVSITETELEVRRRRRNTAEAPALG